MTEEKKEGFVIYEDINKDGIIGKDWYDVAIHNKDISGQLEYTYKSMQDVVKENSKAVWVLLKRHRDLGNEEFKIQYKQFIKELKATNNYKVAELLHAYGLLLSYSKKEIIPMDKEEAKELIKRKIVCLENQNFEKIYKEQHLDLAMGWGGYSFWDQTEDMKKMMEFALAKQGKKGQEEIVETFLKNIEDLPNYIRELSRAIYKDAGNNGKSHKVPIFSYIKDKEKFFIDMFSLDIDDIQLFISALEKRYQTDYSNGKVARHLMVEKDFTKEFILYLKNKQEKPMLYDLKSTFCNHFLTSLEPILQAFEKQEVAEETDISDK